MTLRYKNGFPDYLNQYELVNHRHYAAARKKYHSSLIVPVGFAALGIIGSYPSNIYMVCIIAAGLGMYLAWALPFKSHYLQHVEASLLPIPERDIELEVGENGILERVEGIESFCPWRSITGYCVFRETLFIELKANVWAIIPARSLSPTSPQIALLIGRLHENGIAKKSDLPLPKD